MNKILVFVGNRQVGDRDCESYQVLANLSYLSRDYLETWGRETFLKEVSKELAGFIAEKKVEGRLDIANGFRINENGKLERVGRLEDAIVGRLGELLKENTGRFIEWGVAVPLELTN